jgi:hypothetical protein
MVSLSNLSYQLQYIIPFTVVKVATMLKYVVIFDIFKFRAVYGERTRVRFPMVSLKFFTDIILLWY